MMGLEFKAVTNREYLSSALRYMFVLGVVSERKGHTVDVRVEPDSNNKRGVEGFDIPNFP